MASRKCPPTLVRVDNLPTNSTPESIRQEFARFGPLEIVSMSKVKAEISSGATAVISFANKRKLTRLMWKKEPILVGGIRPTVTPLESYEFFGDTASPVTPALLHTRTSATENVHYGLLHSVHPSIVCSLGADPQSLGEFDQDQASTEWSFNGNTIPQIGAWLPGELKQIPTVGTSVIWAPLESQPESTVPGREFASPSDPLLSPQLDSSIESNLLPSTPKSHGCDRDETQISHNSSNAHQSSVCFIDGIPAAWGAQDLFDCLSDVIAVDMRATLVYSDVDSRRIKQGLVEFFDPVVAKSYANFTTKGLDYVLLLQRSSVTSIISIRNSYSGMFTYYSPSSSSSSQSALFSSPNPRSLGDDATVIYTPMGKSTGPTPLTDFSPVAESHFSKNRDTSQDYQLTFTPLSVNDSLSNYGAAHSIDLGTTELEMHNMMMDRASDFLFKDISEFESLGSRGSPPESRPRERLPALRRVPVQPLSPLTTRPEPACETDSASEGFDWESPNPELYLSKTVVLRGVAAGHDDDLLGIIHENLGAITPNHVDITKGDPWCSAYVSFSSHAEALVAERSLRGIRFKNPRLQVMLA